jgi:ribokinase
LSRQKHIVVVGSINLDLVAIAERIPAVGETVIGSDFQIHPGGKGANQAVSIARLGYPVCMIGRLGDDGFGSQLRTHLETAGVDVAGVATIEGPSGVAMIEVSGTGENTIIVAQGANAKLTPDDIEMNHPMIRDAGLVLTQLEIPLETVEHLSSVCARESIPLIIDPAPARDLPQTIFNKIAWFTPNETEAAFYAADTNSKKSMAPSEIASRLLAMGCQGVVLKLGSHGICLASRDQPVEMLPAFRVKAIDTTAAGDAFNGAFAVGLMLGKTARESAIFAAGAAAISVTRAGAQPSMPTMAEVVSFVGEYMPLES